EYDFTRQYLAFEQLRYEDRLKVDVQIDPESFNFDIPPFSIQTLAENAVRHAISNRPEGGSLWIKCSSHDGSLTVSVRDDGRGNRPVAPIRVASPAGASPRSVRICGRPARARRPRRVRRELCRSTANR